MKRLAIIGLVVVGVLGLGTGGLLAGPPPFDGMPDQQSNDSPDPNNANWVQMEGGVAGRPYVAALSVVNGGSVTQIITDGSPAAETNIPVGRIAVSISPVNLCRQGQAPAQGVCYATPNRIGVTVGYQIQPGQLGYDFGDPKVPLIAPVTEDTEFDITLNLNSLGRTLRWTWANGVPTYWRTTNLGSDDASLRIRLKPALMPLVLEGNNQVGCSAIPVMVCPYTQSTHEVLSANLVLSLDSTLDAVFTGSLFASTRSYMGSLMANPGETPQMTYGVSAPRTWSDGASNSSQFNAVLSDAAILNFYGATADMASTTGFQAAALNVTRTDGGSQGPITWSRWSAAVQGSDGWLITIPDIRYALVTSASAVRTSASAKVAPAQFRVKSRTTPLLRASASGSKSRVSFKATSSTCAKYSCRVVVSIIKSKVSSKTTRIATVNLSRKTKSVSTNLLLPAKRGQRVAAVLQAKKGAKWVYVASSMTTSR